MEFLYVYFSMSPLYLLLALSFISVVAHPILFDYGRVKLDNYRSKTNRSAHVTNGVHVPKYMLDLFNNKEEESYSNYLHRMTSDKVKSYINTNKDVYKADIVIGADNGTETNTRTHNLIFNITPPADDDVVDYGELRLYTLIARDQHNYQGVDRLVTILLVIPMSGERATYEVLDVQHVYEKSNSWETFNVTAAINMWRKMAFIEQRLQVRIDSLFMTVGGSGHMDIFTHPYEENEPLLLVYLSNKNSKKRHILNTEATENSHNVRKRNVNDVMSSSAVGIEDEEEESNVIANYATNANPFSEESGKSGQHKVSKKKRLRNPCRRRPLSVHFEEINYDTWIIAPKSYEAFECAGKCYFPLSDHLQPTQHAIVQTLLHALSPKKASRACCVPTKLDSISILYVDKDGAVTYKYRHEDMVALECGCR
ncbi:Bone morphoproteintic protein 10 [Chamberlinius hualienensis]